MAGQAKRALVLCAAVLAVGGVTPVASAAPVAGQCANPTGRYGGAVPWGQRLIGPQSIWPLTTGAGQLVAVVGTGVDGANAQFSPGQVLPVRDVSGSGAGQADCDGRGTIAAGIIAAQQDSSTTFAGMAPGVRILPVRYVRSSGQSESNSDSGALAAGITTAAQAGAGVILVAVPATSDSPALESAVADAIRGGAVVVSAAAASQQGAQSYPTSAQGVLGVGSTNQAGAAVQTESGDVAISAPGADLVSTSAGAAGAVAQRFPVTDPGLAAAYVAGAAALVRAYHPELRPAQVVGRLTLTASRPPSGAHDPQLGWGTLDAYAAVSAVLPSDAAPGGIVTAGLVGAVAPAADAGQGVADTSSGVVVLIGVALAAAAGVVIAAVRRGRRRGWRPARFSPH
ncbi:MAG: peptidase and in, kexin, sedolisin [Amycolatopsis sp.]|uniref:S8 family serine peptidase n=1 Tax=Amycolatopsis sp. TaxID=37632 RepID=UPI002608D238|nr:S8 family serine peptidase [Amycolatopsis sp.]MCU1683762.1 peptidase and in, kexin, sedolisin [Amycolatopsis sp.]